MAIRLATLEKLADRRKRVFRVRRRGWDKPREWDTDGSESICDTWGRWEEDYYSNWNYAWLACAPERDTGGWGRRGYMDQVQAVTVLARLRRSIVAEDLTRFEDGRYRVIPPQMVENAKLA